MPRGVYVRKHKIEVLPLHPLNRRVVPQQTLAAISRWEQVKDDRQQFMEPFHKLPIERAMAYLEDLRSIIEDGGHLLNERIGNDKNKMRCSGPRCGKDLSGLRPNKMPLWIAKKDMRDKQFPDIIRSLYFCSEACTNAWSRAQGGWAGNDGGGVPYGEDPRYVELKAKQEREAKVHK